MTQQTQNHQLADLFHAACHSGNMDFPRLTNLCYHLMQVENVPGAIVEFGTQKGKTAVVLAAMSKKPVWLYDSFKGLPAKSCYDITEAKFVEGYFKCSPLDCLNTFKAAGLSDLPIIVASAFDKIDVSQLPGCISFAHLDADLHDSTLTALEIVYPRLVPGAVCFLDDYSYHGLPGVKIAVDKFLHGKPEMLVHPMTLGYRAHQAWFVKL